MSAVAMFHVRDVEASSRWYQEILAASSGHGGPDFEMILDSDGQLILQLHRTGGNEHGPVGPHNGERPGAGVIVYFDEPDLGTALVRARGIQADVVSEPQWVELAHHFEMVLRDPDGYLVALVSNP